MGVQTGSILCSGDNLFVPYSDPLIGVLLQKFFPIGFEEKDILVVRVVFQPVFFSGTDRSFD